MKMKFGYVNLAIHGRNNELAF